MELAEARKLESTQPQADVELRPSELEDLERLNVDEVTALLQRRFRRYVACGCDHCRALLLAVGLS